MADREPDTVRFVVCMDNEGYEASLELHKIHRVVGEDEAAADGDLRVVDESGEDLCPSSLFVSIDVPMHLEKALLRVR